jgi:tRNA dimethylallyltransferase
VSVPKIVILAGPTASGKTALACALAEMLNGEVISADSQQCYRGLDVGTAKPTHDEQARARHHLLDIAWPEEQLDVAQFISRADAAIADVLKRGKTALVAGGTGLWIRALVRGLVDAPGRDDAFRARTRERIEREGLGALYTELEQIDPEAAARILPGDRTRIERALEVFAQGGQTISSLQRAHRFAEKRFRARVVFLDPPRAVLWDRVERRTRSFFSSAESSIVRETSWLRARIGQIPSAAKALGIIGYGETALAIDQGLSQESIAEAERQVAARTRQYAKRQRTWFRKDAPALDETGRPIPWPPEAGREAEGLNVLCSTLREWYEAAP